MVPLRPNYGVTPVRPPRVKPRLQPRLAPTIFGNEPVGVGSAPCTPGGRIALAVASGKRAFISRRKPSSVSTLAAILAIAPNSALVVAVGLLAGSNSARAAS